MYEVFLSPTGFLIGSICAYISFKIAKWLCAEVQLYGRMRKLPSLPITSWIGLLIGNVEIYYNSFYHLPPEIGLQKVVSSLHAIDDIQNRGLLVFRFGFRRMVALLNAEAIGSLVSHTENISKTYEYMYMKDWLGLGLVTCTGARWRAHRKLVTPAFHFKKLENFVPIMNRNARIFFTRIERKMLPLHDRRQGVDIRFLMSGLTLNTVTEATMGIQIGAQNDDLHRNEDEFVALVNFAMLQSTKRVMNPLLHWDFIYRLTKTGRKNLTSSSKMYDFIRRVIQQQKVQVKAKLVAEMANENLKADQLTQENMTFLDSLLLEHLKNPSVFTEEDVLFEVSTIILGGYDTTSISLSAALFLISENPDVQDKIYEELCQILGDDMDREISERDCKKMRYIELVLKESMRIFPGTPLISRKVEHDFVCRGYTIPRGSSAVAFIYLLHRDPKIFPEPEKFRPERFLPESAINRTPYSYLPFSAGPRNCIGQQFAMLQMKLVVANVVRHFRLTAISKRDDIQIGFAVFLRLLSPILIRFERR